MSSGVINLTRGSQCVTMYSRVQRRKGVYRHQGRLHLLPFRAYGQSPVHVDDVHVVPGHLQAVVGMLELVDKCLQCWGSWKGWGDSAVYVACHWTTE